MIIIEGDALLELYFTDLPDNYLVSNATIDGTPPPPGLNTPLAIRTLKRNIKHCLQNKELSKNVKRTLFGAYNMSVAGD
ncbi:hypothetical protein GGP41_002772 [Bipolaris sorokiniana]|uniref:Uncharacterized protein n=1 Tax=Cochliobolus sativus TaxID=45130 RepID=A0A8H6DPV4_COCSA|nr:hypothetical protein GGP41_002772 [Bipolaris sorokiniana]